GAAKPGSGARGAWPTAAAPGQGIPAPAAAAPAPAAPAAAAAAAPAPAGAAAPSPGMAAGAGQVQAMWPGVLEAVKNRRRFTWILLSQNAQVTGFDGTTLQLGFPNAGARDNFASSGSEDVLKAVLAEQFQVNWKIDAVVGQGGGQSAPHAAVPAYAAPPAPAYSPPAPAPAPAPAPVQQAPAAPQEPRPPQSPQVAAAPQPPVHQAPPPVAPEDDVPEEDDPDLVDSALTGHELIVRELGATVVEEYTNE
ncbi:DNA polymerase III subunit gamma and tau, partial [Streptomyces sp. NPDC059851]